ncbi:ABC transporter permease [Mesorhizobium sp. VNQ89]|uniref:ABC transporter permease n=1 Tax=Mesorhizobium quangtriensis TaxID=3157709 RepID=UPI0032B86D11
MAETTISTPSVRRGFFGRFNLEVRGHMPTGQQILVVAAGIMLGLLISAMLLVLSGVNPSGLVNEFVVAIFTSKRNVAAVLSYAAPLTIVGLAAALAFKARFWNIGLEGQVILGAIGATLVANHDFGPPALRLVIMALAAMAAGVLWIGLPLFLKIRLQVNEIISTLLMNYIAFNLLLHLLYGPWKDPQSAFPNSKLFDEVERLMPIGWQNLNLALPIAVLLVLLTAWLLGMSRYGFLLNFVHANARMARALGVRIVGLTVLFALASGALAGFGGFIISTGIESRLTQSFFAGYGFSGILIAFLARNNPFAVAFFAVLVAILMVAGQSLQVFYQIPFAMVQLIQAIIVICVAASEFFIHYRLRMVE